MTRAELMKETMRGMVGLPYRWGGDDPLLGFDCSGGVMEVLKTVGICSEGMDLSSSMMAQRWPQLGSAPYKTGDLICMASNSNLKAVNHVVMVYDRSTDDLDPYCFEFGGGGSDTTTLEVAAKRNAYGRIRPLSSILARGKVVVAVVRPAAGEVEA